MSASKQSARAFLGIALEVGARIMYLSSEYFFATPARQHTQRNEWRTFEHVVLDDVGDDLSHDARVPVKVLKQKVCDVLQVRPEAKRKL
jgi:hypothetical protein